MLLYFHVSPLPFYIFILFLTLVLCSLCADDEVRYFINCGSSMNVFDTNTEKTFFGDDKNDTVHISGHGDMHTNEGNLSGSLYQTARVFKKTASYDFNLLLSGTYFVRLHICATSSDLADSYFSVSASRHMLLPDFKPGINSNCSSTKPWEFILSISNANKKLRIYFDPNASSIAFVNAIEVLSTTSNFSKDRYPYVSPAGRVGDYKNMDSSALETIYRINVGEKQVGALSDKLGRTWIPDDLFLVNKDDAQNDDKSSSVDYSQGPATEDDAPRDVYGTAKMLKSTLNSSFISNLTWQFNVSRGTEYFVRAHFCDIISPANSGDSFNFYINKNFSQVIAPSNITNGTELPFFKDYVAGSGDLAYLNISVGPNNGQGYRKYLFLNGLEIMQVRNESVYEPQIKDSHLPLIAGLVASAVAVMGIVATILVCLHLKRRRNQVIEAFEWGNLPLYNETSSHHRASESSSSHASNFQNIQLSLKIPFVVIQRVTNNFDAELIIGEGGFGKVYKGTFRSGFNVAVKRGSQDHGQGIEEFQNEIMILSKIRHRHLVALIGYCCENGEMILVYEFMEKGTLRYHLYDSNKSSTSSTKEVLSWKQRLEICIGAAEGIGYLHKSTTTTTTKPKP